MFVDALNCTGIQFSCGGERNRDNEITYTGESRTIRFVLVELKLVNESFAKSSEP